MAKPNWRPSWLVPTHIRRARKLRSDQTQAEALLWSLLRASRVCGLKFRRQHPIGPFIADFVCVEEKLVVEIDGEYHESQFEKDRERQEFLESKGWRVLRFTNQEVMEDADSVAIAIAKILDRPFSIGNRSGNVSGMVAKQIRDDRKRRSSQ